MMSLNQKFKSKPKITKDEFIKSFFGENTAVDMASSDSGSDYDANTSNLFSPSEVDVSRSPSRAGS